mgnify:CR=1 FL=1
MGADEMKQTEDFTQDTVTDEMNVAGEPERDGRKR